jgi:hypothetical protein
MSKYYIIDTTLQKGGKNPVLIFESVPSTVRYLEGMCQRQFGRTRKQHMQHCEDLGFGGDEPTGRAFFEQMEQYFTVGIVRSDSKPIKCNIFEANTSALTKDVHGD